MAGERVVLDEVLKQLKAERAPALTTDKYFEWPAPGSVDTRLR